MQSAQTKMFAPNFLTILTDPFHEEVEGASCFLPKPEVPATPEKKLSFLKMI